MKKHISFWLVMFLAISLALPIYSMAQILTLESSSGDRISGAKIKTFSLGQDGNLVIYLDGPFTFADLLPDISVDGTSGSYSGCTVSPPASVNATQPASGTDLFIKFTIKSTSNATFTMPVPPEPSAPQNVLSFDGKTISWNIGGSTPVAVGSYLAVFEGTISGITNKSQLVVMIKITPAETVTPPTGISPSAGTANQAISFTASGATVSTAGHTVEYRFDWGDNSGLSGWSGSPQAHPYTNTGTFAIKAQARCAQDQVESAWYTGSVTISNVQLYTLTTSVSPSGAGTVSVSPAGPYSLNAVVTVTATPNQGYTFSSWGGDAYGSVNPTTVTMNGNKNVIATFSAVSSCNRLDWGIQTTITLQAGAETCYVATVDSGRSLMWIDLYGITQELEATVTWIFPDGSTSVGWLVADKVNTGIKYRSLVPPGEYKFKINCTGSGSILTRTYLY